MVGKTTWAALSVVALLIGCAGQQQGTATGDGTGATASAAPSTPGARMVKSRDGRYEGEVIGTPAPGSRFAKLQIGMTMEEVSTLIGAPDNMIRHETGKRWIPFYFGNDAQRLQVIYRNEGCLTYTGGNVFGGGGSELIRITVAPKGGCLDT
ncbi:hypothetical protein FZ942_16715 [Azospirillum lipoferum]|uniref:Outer membrane protein assembly factor BamE n=1 Tax=Azospirillum lipoferum TaxID=193 RepID=A0A5A9GNV2_AZOLI|nr:MULTISPECIES: hypothetical protein [Azospirillum]KAA0595274.1 hypothetical protein FZ942_16715 [Azospirillum lipoferum]MDW5533398.1 hypothetical protein [Azospirillum sp. NL1]